MELLASFGHMEYAMHYYYTALSIFTSCVIKDRDVMITLHSEIFC